MARRDFYGWPDQEWPEERTYCRGRVYSQKKATKGKKTVEKRFQEQFKVILNLTKFLNVFQKI